MGWLKQPSTFALPPHSAVKQTGVLWCPATLPPRLNTMLYGGLRNQIRCGKINFCMKLRTTSQIKEDNAECIPQSWFHSLSNQQDGQAQAGSIVKALSPQGIRKTMALFNFFSKASGWKKMIDVIGGWVEQSSLEGGAASNAQTSFHFSLMVAMTKENWGFTNLHQGQSLSNMSMSGPIQCCYITMFSDNMNLQQRKKKFRS